MKRLLLVLLLLAGIPLQGCVQGELVSDERYLQREIAEPLDLKLYRFNVGDTLDIEVFGEGDLSREYNIDAEGAISFPLIGTLQMEGLNIYEAEALLIRQLKDGYLIDPSISVTVSEYRPFSVLGEVNVAGSYEFLEGMSIAEAVAMSSGFTYRAEKDRFEVLRRGETGWERLFLKIADEVYPGDVIYVRERFF